MTLIDRYLNEIRPFLPAESREDILRELHASIEEQVADRATERGRPVGREDESAVLARLGHPLKVAAGYQPRRHLIGPDLYPVFVQTAKTLLVVILAFQIVVALIAAATSGATVSVLGMALHLAETAFVALAIIVAVFAGIEFSGERLKWYERWQPDSLGRASVHVIRRGDVGTNLISEGVFLLWWNGALRFGDWLPALGASVSLSAAWAPLHWPLNIVVGAFFAVHTYVLIRGVWQRGTLVAEIVLGIPLLAAAAMLITGGNLVSAAGDVGGDFLAALDRTARIAVGVIAAFVLWDAVLAARRLARPTAADASAASEALHGSGRADS